MDEYKALIAGIVPSSFTDGPGNRMVVFFQGCNLRCVYCQNPETWDVRGANNPLCNWWKLDDLLNIFNKYSSFLSGITFSGGEALLQWKFIREFSIKFKKMFHNKNLLVDTNCDVDSLIIEEIIKFIDYFSPDIKAPIEKIYVELTGGLGNFKNLISNVKLLYDSGKIYEIRLPIVPNFTDNDEMYLEWVRLLETIFDHDVRIRVIKFRPHGVKNPELKNLEVDNQKVVKFIKMLNKAGFKKIVYLDSSR